MARSVYLKISTKWGEALLNYSRHQIVAGLRYLIEIAVVERDAIMSDLAAHLDNLCDRLDQPGVTDEHALAVIRNEFPIQWEMSLVAVDLETHDLLVDSITDATGEQLGAGLVALAGRLREQTIMSDLAAHLDNLCDRLDQPGVTDEHALAVIRNEFPIQWEMSLVAVEMDSSDIEKAIRASGN